MCVAPAIMLPHLPTIIRGLLLLSKETQSDEVNTILQRLVSSYEDDIAPVALDMIDELVMEHYFANVYNEIIYTSHVDKEL